MSLMNADTLVERFAQGDHAALARIISLVENRDPVGYEVYGRLYGRCGPAWRVGITGATGCGKSTLIARLAEYFRREGRSIGIVAIDPTSPFTSGALLGDRLRMNALVMDDEVFIRSMATRGIIGGLSRAARMAADILEAFGKDIVFIETVGVGQAEKDILHAVDSAVLVLAPHSGDFIQMMKAGIMEIANLFVLNKCDQPGADEMANDLNGYLDMLGPAATDAWRQPVIPVQADRARGVEDLCRALTRHRAHAEREPANAAKRRRVRRQISDLYMEDIATRLRDGLRLDERIEAATDNVLAGAGNPIREAEQLLRATRIAFADDTASDEKE